MFKSLLKIKYFKSKNIIIIILIAIMLFIIFWMFFLISIKTIRSILSKEGFDPSTPPPTTESIKISIKDDTPSNKQIDPEAFGKYYLTTENNIGKKNIITMGEESSFKIEFDASSNTKILIYPIKMEHTDKHKANIFPPNFTVNISFPDLSKNFITRYTDVSGDEVRNYVNEYISPNGDVSGNFINILLAIPNIQSPIYENKTTNSDIGYVDKPYTNNYKITVTDKGNILNGIFIKIKPPN